MKKFLLIAVAISTMVFSTTITHEPSLNFGYRYLTAIDLGLAYTVKMPILKINNTTLKLGGSIELDYTAGIIDKTTVIHSGAMYINPVLEYDFNKFFIKMQTGLGMMFTSGAAEFSENLYFGGGIRHNNFVFGINTGFRNLQGKMFPLVNLSVGYEINQDF